MIKLKTLVGEGIVFRTETRGAHHGQSDLTLYAENEMGEYMGHLDYSEYNGEPAVQMIKVKPNFRRSGIGTLLLKKLQTLYPDTEIELGMSIGHGTDLVKSLSTVYVENPEYTRLEARLEKLKAAEKKLQQWIANHKGPMVPRVGDAFNHISDEMYDIEQKLSRMKPGKTLLLEKNLYHGTTAEKAKRIEKHGLIPQAGEFVSNAYDELAEVEPLPELAFATDKKRLQVAVTAAIQHVANELGKGFHDVSDQEFFNHAAILKFYESEHQFSHRPEGDENYYGQHPSTVEPGDYYTEHILIPDEILTGNGMIRLLKQNGCWPRNYTFQGPSDDHKRDMLIKHYIKKNPKYPKNAIIKRVMDLDHRDLNYWYERDIKGYV